MLTPDNNIYFSDSTSAIYYAAGYATARADRPLSVEEGRQIVATIDFMVGHPLFPDEPADKTFVDHQKIDALVAQFIS